MAKLYLQRGSSKYYAHVKIWSDDKNKFIWSRIATKTDNAIDALLFAEAVERASEQVKPLAGSNYI